LNPVEEAKTKAELVPLTPEEALDFLMENGFSKNPCMSIRLESKKRNFDIYPSYKQIIGAKDKSSTKGLYITECVASVSLQNLLNHTAERIMLLQKDMFNVYKDISGLTLVPFGFTDENNSDFPINFELKITLIDGKVLNTLTETNSTQSCPICGEKPLEFMTVANVQSNKFTPKNSQVLEYGVSPLLAWIRFFQFVLKVSYRIGIDKWQVRDP